MGEYATKDDDNKWIASDGKKYKTRSGAWKWSKKLEEKSNPAPVKTESISESKIDDPGNDDNTPNYNYSEPDWIIDDIDGSSDNQEFVPGILKRIKPVSERRGKRSKKEIEADIQLDFDAGLRGIHRLPDVARKGCLLAYEYYIRLFEKIKSLPASRIKEERIRVADWEKMFIYFQLALRK